MQEALAFYGGRNSASRTMANETCLAADRPGVKVVALNIGYAHTEGIAAMLAEQGRPYAVLKPRSRDNEGLSMDALDRKYNRASVFSEGGVTEFLRAFEQQSRKKPEPVLNEPWLQAKYELYHLTRNIARRVLQVSSGPAHLPLFPALASRPAIRLQLPLVPALASLLRLLPVVSLPMVLQMTNSVENGSISIRRG